jgi:replicative DNA helicase
MLTNTKTIGPVNSGSQGGYKPLSQQEPNAIYAEQVLLGVLLGCPGSIDSVVSLLNVEDFYAPQHREIYSTLVNMAGNGGVVNYVAVQDRLRQMDALEKAGGDFYLTELVSNTPGSADSVTEYAELIRGASARRKVMKVAGDMRDVIANASNDLEQATIPQIDRMMQVLRDSGRLREPVPVGKIVAEVLQEIDSRSSGNSPAAIKTGFHDLDSNLLGGFRRGDLVVIAGRPSMGKTSIAMQIGAQVSMLGESVMVFTLEMSKSAITERWLAQVGGIDFSRIVRGTLNNQDFERITNAAMKFDGLPLLVDDQGGLTVQDIAARARTLKKTRGLSMIVVDYLQIMGYAGRSNNRNEQLGEMSRMMKALAKELDVAFVLLSQLNRDVEKRIDKRPLMSDLRESGAIEQDADVVIMMYRDEYYNKASEFPGIAEAIIRKSRNGETGTVGLGWEGNMVRFTNLGAGIGNNAFV